MQETDDKRVIAVKDGPLRMEFFHRHVSDSFRIYGKTPVDSVKQMIEELVEYVASTEGKGSCVGLGIRSEEIKGVSHDVLWRSTEGKGSCVGLGIRSEEIKGDPK